MTRPELSEYGAHYDLALACSKAMASGLDLIDPSQSEAQKLITTGKGFLEFFPYAHTFWAEHVLNFAALHGSLHEQTTWTLHRHLLEFSSKHDYLALSVPGPATVPPSPSRLYSETDASLDRRLQYMDARLIFYPVLAKTIAFRESSKSQSRESDEGRHSNVRTEE